VLVFNRGGDLLLQKRSYTKDVAPGRWDTSVGGHVGFGEHVMISSQREMEEELGIVGYEPEYLYSYMHSNPYETELVMSYRCIYEGKITFNQEEIDEVRFWSFDDIMDTVGKEVLSDNFEHEFQTYLNYCNQRL
jgi:isopentenyldiphosphate isomerase